jgi:hypothetical protein
MFQMKVSVLISLSIGKEFHNHQHAIREEC